MSGEYTPNSFEGFFTHSHDSGGDYSLAGNSDCFMVRWEPAEDKRTLVVRTTEDAFSVEPWVARGIRCHASKMPFWEQNRGHLVVECENPDFFAVMNRICVNLIENEILSAQEVIQTFKQERAFWSSVPVSLTAEAAAGLFGSCFSCSSISKNRYPTSLKLVNGKFSDKDLNWDNLQIEIKTSLSTSSPTKHTVSSFINYKKMGVL